MVVLAFPAGVVRARDKVPPFAPLLMTPSSELMTAVPRERMLLFPVRVTTVLFPKEAAPERAPVIFMKLFCVDEVLPPLKSRVMTPPPVAVPPEFWMTSGAATV